MICICLREQTATCLIVVDGHSAVILRLLPLELAAIGLDVGDLQRAHGLAWRSWGQRNREAEGIKTLSGGNRTREQHVKLTIILATKPATRHLPRTVRLISTESSPCLFLAVRMYLPFMLLCAFMMTSLVLLPVESTRIVSFVSTSCSGKECKGCCAPEASRTRRSTPRPPASEADRTAQPRPRQEHRHDSRGRRRGESSRVEVGRREDERERKRKKLALPSVNYLLDNSLATDKTEAASERVQ